MPSPLNIDTAKLQSDLTAALVNAVNGLIADTNANLQTYAQQIITDTTEAAAAGDTELLAMIRDQALMLAEIERLQVVAHSRAAFAEAVTIVLDIAARLVIPAIPLI